MRSLSEPVAVIEQRVILALYLRREAPQGPFWRRQWLVAVYDAPPETGCRPRHVYDWDDADAPRKGQRAFQLGGFHWRAVWLRDRRF